MITRPFLASWGTLLVPSPETVTTIYAPLFWAHRSSAVGHKLLSAYWKLWQ